MGWALQMKWIWTQKSARDRPWAGLEIPMHPHAQAMFAISLITEVGNGKTQFFGRLDGLMALGYLIWFPG